jgi:hypothetical protein
MAKLVFDFTGIDRLRWEFVARSGEPEDVVLNFADSEGRLLPKKLVISGFQMSEWHFQEQVYDRCDEVRVLDQNLDGAQLEFGRFVVQFVRSGKVLGEHAVDLVEIRRAREIRP